MFDVLLLLTIGVGMSGSAVVYWRWRRRQSIPQLASPVQSLPAPSTTHLAEMPLALETANASRSGALALNAIGTTRGRPGHRCVEEIRRRCESDFVGAIHFLEGQLNRRVSDNSHEQSRYWVDLAEGLRLLNLHEALPALLRRTDDAMDAPLGEGYAAEVVSFVAFAEYLHDPLTAEGQAALRVLRTAMEATRHGRLPATLFSDAAFGDAVRRLSENCPDCVNPRLALVFIEAMRHGRRTFHTLPVFRDDPVRRQTVRWQHAFTRDAEPIMREYLHDIAPELTRLLEVTQGRARMETLLALDELQADTDDAALNLLGDPTFEHRALAIRSLRWSRSPLTLPALCGIARHAITGERSARWLRRLGVGKGPLPAVEVFAALRALRGHPSEEAEKVLLQYVQRPETEWRRAALQSLCWWEPLRRQEVMAALRVAQQDANPEVRCAALAALARLGECAALQVLHESLHGTHPGHVRQTIRLCGSEGLSWLWPELDALTESDHDVVAFEAWEAIEALRENFMGVLG